jgi:hypothetical protein
VPFTSVGNTNDTPFASEKTSYLLLHILTPKGARKAKVDPFRQQLPFSEI